MKIKWQCVKSSGWDWRGGDDAAIAGAPNQLEGTIDLPPNENFWYMCGYLILDKTVGVAAVRYYQDANGANWIQAMADARGAWHSLGDPNNLACNSGATGTSGGITLTASFV